MGRTLLCHASVSSLILLSTAAAVGEELDVEKTDADGVALFEAAYPAQYRFLKTWFDERLSQEQQAALIDALEQLRATPDCDKQGDSG